MSKLIPTLLVLHSSDLEERLADEVKFTGHSKSSIAREALDKGFAKVMEMSRGQILELSHNDKKYSKLPRISTFLHFKTDSFISLFASVMNIPVWKIYSLSIDVGLETILTFPPQHN